ncbi:cysteine protease StiP family protein [Oceanirhabdus seepicola]|uniref:Cysteine protease StiP family protein n=1 Tax=Oceanirhabdus seepicola TaxID=2828781 RepID=A0A9J6NUY0_9CLOT|nr:cysteine protease StiP family protein [Oceanirhabdus seepicola]MCM1988287.1 cysteine protease StiP family protein [Oceanirhabdus seepicola]
MKEALSSGSYSPDDVIFLLKLINNELKEMDTFEREQAIQKGVSYSNMLPIEYEPSEEYVQIFMKTLEETKEKIATLTAVLSEKIIKKRGSKLILVSLARAGTPIGILVKRFIKYKYEIDLPHYSVSIIREAGLDENAVKFMIEKHGHSNIQFIDGWTGKGVIKNTLENSCESFKNKYGIELNSDLAVLADPGRICSTYATREDFLIPNACLNSTVSGLMSRTVLNKDIIGEDDFHGSKFYQSLIKKDLSQYYVDTISQSFNLTLHEIEYECEEPDRRGLKDIEKIKAQYDIEDINFIKPGVGETTRVLLRRVPWMILVNTMDNPNLEHIYRLAKEKGIPIKIIESKSYSCFGLIKQLRGRG